MYSLSGILAWKIGIVLLVDVSQCFDHSSFITVCDVKNSNHYTVKHSSYGVFLQAAVTSLQLLACVLPKGGSIYLCWLDCHARKHGLFYWYQVITNWLRATNDTTLFFWHKRSQLVATNKNFSFGFVSKSNKWDTFVAKDNNISYCHPVCRKIHFYASSAAEFI